jgi:hypothetical protein
MGVAVVGERGRVGGVGGRESGVGGVIVLLGEAEGGGGGWGEVGDGVLGEGAGVAMGGRAGGNDVVERGDGSGSLHRALTWIESS